MARPSYSSQEKHEVFLSFRGEDTRKGFVSHLYAALLRKNIHTFLDDEGLKRGDELSPTILKAIEGAKISIIVLSENYASSRWCLDELVQIIECKNTAGQIVLPVFYNVNPTDIRNQSGTFGDAFAEHERQNQFKVQIWKTTLHKVSNLAGWDSTRIRSEFELVENVVEDVLQKLNYIIDPPVPSGLVGIYKRIADVESLLCMESDNVRMVGIWGMGGIGKTTIADALFKKHYSQFEGHFFCANVRGKWKSHQNYDMWNELKTQILGDRSPSNVNSGFVEKRIQRKKILIVLDDVSEPQQLEKLIGKKDLYGPGSRIIVTTRDKNVLQSEYDGLYEVELLDFNEARQLFCLKAFGQVQPKSELIHLTDMVVNHAGGNPLALTVLGSHLCSRNTREWESALQKLKKIPHADIYKILRLSYDELDVEEQYIFLDFSSILTGEKKWRAARLLDGCGFSTDTVMRTLQDKSLITIEKDQTITMHDLIKEMGHQIICEESIKKPEERSRMWDPKDIYNAFRGKMGSDHPVELESILLNMSEIKEISISPTAFARMPGLRFLKFYMPNGERRCNVHIPQGIEVLPFELRYLRWDCFPEEALPASFNAENLVELDLRHSLIEKLWDGEKDLANLKSLYLSGCKNLLELPNLSKAENLKELHLDFCKSLCEVPSYVLSLDHLLALNLEGCTELQSVKSNMHCKSLRWLNLNGCSKLVEFSVTSEKLEYLSLKDTAIEEFPSSVWQAKSLSCLYLSGCLRLKKLPPLVDTSLSIRSLFLDGCSNLSELPENINLLSALNNLSVQGCCIETLPASIKNLSQLRSLDVSNCKMLQSLPELPLLLQHLNAKGCASLDTISSSAATTLVQNSFGSQNCDLLLRQHQELKTSLRHFHYLDMFEFNHCRRLDENAREIIMGEAMIRIKYAVYLSSVAQAYADPYHQFQLFAKDSDTETFELTCHQLCFRPLGGDVPDWFWLQEIESSTLIIKLNANCCSDCKYSALAFGFFQTNKDEDPCLKFGGRHRICVKQLVESPVLWFEKLWYNDVRVALPRSRIPSCFRYRTRFQTRVTFQLLRSSDLLGFAFCVISSHFPSTDKEFFPMIRCECYLDDAEKIGPCQSHYCYPSELEWKLISDSAFLWYDVKTSNSILEGIKESNDPNQFTTYNPRLSFQFYSKSGVEECGVWPIYAFDIDSQSFKLEIQALMNNNSHQEEILDINELEGARTSEIENQDELQKLHQTNNEEKKK